MLGAGSSFMDCSIYFKQACQISCGGLMRACFLRDGTALCCIVAESSRKMVMSAAGCMTRMASVRSVMREAIVCEARPWALSRSKYDEADLHQHAQWAAVDLELLERLQPQDGRSTCCSLFQLGCGWRLTSSQPCHPDLGSRLCGWRHAELSIQHWPILELD